MQEIKSSIEKMKKRDGRIVEFDPEQTMHIGSNGIPVNPESLYEAQLRNRLGYIPAWLNALK